MTSLASVRVTSLSEVCVPVASFSVRVRPPSAPGRWRPRVALLRYVGLDARNGGLVHSRPHCGLPVHHGQGDEPALGEQGCDLIQVNRPEEQVSGLGLPG